MLVSDAESSSNSFRDFSGCFSLDGLHFWNKKPKKIKAETAQIFLIIQSIDLSIGC